MACCSRSRLWRSSPTSAVRSSSWLSMRATWSRRANSSLLDPTDSQTAYQQSQADSRRLCRRSSRPSSRWHGHVQNNAQVASARHALLSARPSSCRPRRRPGFSRLDSGRHQAGEELLPGARPRSTRQRGTHTSKACVRAGGLRSRLRPAACCPEDYYRQKTCSPKAMWQRACWRLRRRTRWPRLSSPRPRISSIPSRPRPIKTFFGPGQDGASQGPTG